MKSENKEFSEQLGTEENEKYPLISIIVPVYNAEKYLELCVNSLLCQTYRNVEIILVNDGSKDNSLMLCYELSRKDDRIKVYSQPNGGASAARNMGLYAAKGSYVTFVDSDDYISEQYVENMFLAAELGHYDIVQCRLESTTKRLERLSPIIFQKADVREITKEQALNARLYKVSVCGKLYIAGILKNFQFREGIIYEDDASYYRFVDRANKIAILDETLYYYYLSDNSVMRNNIKDKSTAFMDIYEERIQYFSEQNNQVLLDGSYSRYCLVLMLKISQGLVNGNNKGDINNFINVFRRYYPKVIGSPHVSWKDKIMFVCFNLSPRYVGQLVGRLKK